MSSDEYLVKYNVNSKDLKKSAIEVVHSPRNAPALPVKQYSSKKAVKEDVLDTMERKPTPKKAEPISTIQETPKKKKSSNEVIAEKYSSKKARVQIEEPQSTSFTQPSYFPKTAISRQHAPSYKVKRARTQSMDAPQHQRLMNPMVGFPQSNLEFYTSWNKLANYRENVDHIAEDIYEDRHLSEHECLIKKRFPGLQKQFEPSQTASFKTPEQKFGYRPLNSTRLYTEDYNHIPRPRQVSPGAKAKSCKGYAKPTLRDIIRKRKYVRPAQVKAFSPNNKHEAKRPLHRQFFASVGTEYSNKHDLELEEFLENKTKEKGKAFVPNGHAGKSIHENHGFLHASFGLPDIKR